MSPEIGLQQQPPAALSGQRTAAKRSVSLKSVPKRTTTTTATIVRVIILVSALAAIGRPSSQQVAAASDEIKASEGPKSPARSEEQSDESASQRPVQTTTATTTSALAERRAFVEQLLRMLHEQYGRTGSEASGRVESKLEAREGEGGAMTRQLLEAIGADGDVRRLVDWVRNSFNLASIGEITTQFVVSKLGSVNCAAILAPDREQSLVPRFLLFNEHFLDVPFELALEPTPDECLARAKFDPLRKTVLLVHGYLSGYTLLDGLTNIKNRLLDLNRLASERTLETFVRMSERLNGSYLLTDDLQAKLRQQQFNVIIVDWFNGANPTPRANYIRAAVNAQVVGRLIARFLSSLVVNCSTPAASLNIIAHSLGCHVSGFTGKAMGAAGHRLGKITHLDPVGLCFGHLFSQPHLRLSPDDALETQAVHVSLNLFDNPLDGAHSNFLVNGGRDQPGCGGQSELKNSTSSSISLLFDPGAKFAPCSHLRALALFEEDLSSRPGQCQHVGYRCASFERFLAGKCGQCDATNGQCRLMSPSPISLHFQTMSLRGPLPPAALEALDELADAPRDLQEQAANRTLSGRQSRRKLPKLYGTPSSYGPLLLGNELERRSDQRLVRAIGKLRTDTRTALAGGWTSLRQLRNHLNGSLELADDQSNNMSEPPLVPPEATTTTTESPQHPAQRIHQEDFVDKVPLGGQQGPEGSINGPLFFLGTSAISPYCVNYYQFRVLIAESRLVRLLRAGALAPNRLASQMGPAKLGRRQLVGGRDMMHLTVKLTDSAGHFFKGFSMLEHVGQLARAADEPRPGAEPMLELTLLLNSTRPEPVRVGESIISYYFHPILLADRVEVNYMSNISPDVRARYSSVLCPAAINDRHQLVKYVDCRRVPAERRK